MNKFYFSIVASKYNDIQHNCIGFLASNQIEAIGLAFQLANKLYPNCRISLHCANEHIVDANNIEDTDFAKK